VSFQGPIRGSPRHLLWACTLKKIAVGEFPGAAWAGSYAARRRWDGGPHSSGRSERSGSRAKNIPQPERPGDGKVLAPRGPLVRCEQHFGAVLDPDGGTRAPQRAGTSGGRPREKKGGGQLSRLSGAGSRAERKAVQTDRVHSLPRAGQRSTCFQGMSSTRRTARALRPSWGDGFADSSRSRADLDPRPAAIWVPRNPLRGRRGRKSLTSTWE